MPGLEGTSFGPYHLKHLLGQGGMAEVYLAYDEALERVVAVKVIGGNNANYLERFRREAETIDKLHHNHILQVFDYDDQVPWHYLVMFYAPGGTLRDLLDDGPLPLDHTAELFDQIASALEHAHNHGIVHRDIKPSNILLIDPHYTLLADFGLARALEGGSELTQSGTLIGTPEYMAPDLTQGPASIASDVYALGVVLYQMVTGRVPFIAETPLAVYWKHIKDEPSPPSHFNPALTPAIDSVILYALNKDPEHRFQSVRELAQAFQQALDAPEQYMIEHGNARSFNTPSPITSPDAVRRSSSRQRSAARRRRMVLHGEAQLSPPVFTSEERSTPSSLPPLPARTPVYRPPDVPITPYVVPLDQSRSGRRFSRRSQRNTRLMLSIIGLGLLFFVILPMGYVYYIYATHSGTPAPTRIVTPSPTSALQAQATSTAQVAANVTHGTPILVDNLAVNTQERWTENGSTCLFEDSSYHVIARQANYVQPCSLLSTSISDAAIQADVSLTSADNAGMLLRMKGEQFYDFGINSQGQFFFTRHDQGVASYVPLIKATSSNAVLMGSAKNTLLVVAKGNDFKLYVNGTFVGEVQDNTYAGGQFALAAGTSFTMTSGEAQFSNCKITSLPAA